MRCGQPHRAWALRKEATDVNAGICPSLAKRPPQPCGGKSKQMVPSGRQVPSDL